MKAAEEPSSNSVQGSSVAEYDICVCCSLSDRRFAAQLVKGLGDETVNGRGLRVNLGVAGDAKSNQAIDSQIENALRASWNVALVISTPRGRPVAPAFPQ